MTPVRNTAFRRCPSATSVAPGNEDLKAGSIWDLLLCGKSSSSFPQNTQITKVSLLVLIKQERRKQSPWPGPPGSHQNTAALQGHGVGTARSQPRVSLKALLKRNWSQSSYALLKGLFMGAEVALNSARSRSRGHDWGSSGAQHPWKGEQVLPGFSKIYFNATGTLVSEQSPAQQCLQSAGSASDAAGGNEDTL